MEACNGYLYRSSGDDRPRHRISHSGDDLLELVMPTAAWHLSHKKSETYCTNTREKNY